MLETCQHCHTPQHNLLDVAKKQGGKKTKTRICQNCFDGQKKKADFAPEKPKSSSKSAPAKAKTKAKGKKKGKK